MSTTIRRLEFDEVCDLFASLGAINSPAELHGILAGGLAAGKRMDYAEWVKDATEFLDTDAALSKEDEEKLQVIYMATLTALADDELGFYPLLPDDDAEMDQRLEQLGLWCHGFMSGFALVEKSIDEVPEVVNDALNDLAAIAQVGINESEDWDDSAEEDYTQIVEYVRLAAMNIFIEYAVEAAEEPVSPQTQTSDEYLSAQSLFKNRQLH